jgi:hypothetical protein
MMYMLCRTGLEHGIATSLLPTLLLSGMDSAYMAQFALNTTEQPLKSWQNNG